MVNVVTEVCDVVCGRVVVKKPTQWLDPSWFAWMRLVHFWSFECGSEHALVEPNKFVL